MINANKSALILTIKSHNNFLSNNLHQSHSFSDFYLNNKQSQHFKYHKKRNKIKKNISFTSSDFDSDTVIDV